jgi:uncharacterized damage-inducible protein DinB
MSAESFISRWKDVRNGFIEEVALVPEDQFSFKATPETRSVAELIQHIIETQLVLTGEACRPDSNLMRQSFPAHTAEYAPDIKAITDKEGLTARLGSSMDDCAEKIRANADKLGDEIKRIDGKSTTKLEFLTFAVAHEMYHRGQFTVYERLLNIKPALTTKLEKFFSEPKAQSAEQG